MGHADTLLALGGAFLAAGLLARLGGRLGLPTIPLFMLAGILLSPNTPGPQVVRDPGELEMLAALGLVLLLFYLGLEFRLDDLRAGGKRLAAAGGCYLLFNVGAGLAFGFALGWGAREALVLAGVLGISSSAIVTKVLIDTGRLRRPETRLILGLIVVEDIFLALYLAALQPVLGGASGPGEFAAQAGKAFGFLLLLAVTARYGTRLAGRLVSVRDDELLVVTFLGTAVLIAGVSEYFGVSDAIGAFMIGLILGSTPSGDRIRTLVHPLRDACAAIFFFSFGLAIEHGRLTAVLAPVVLAVAVTFVTNTVAAVAVARMHAYGPGTTSRIATTLLARGEFALVLAAIAANAGLDARLAPFIAGYVLLLAVTGPLLAKHPRPLARLLSDMRAIPAPPTRKTRPLYGWGPWRTPGPPDTVHPTVTHPQRRAVRVPQLRRLAVAAAFAAVVVGAVTHELLLSAGLVALGAAAFLLGPQSRRSRSRRAYPSR